MEEICGSHTWRNRYDHFAFGADIGSWEGYSADNEKYEFYKSQGYRYFCNVDSSQYFVQITDDYFDREEEIWMDTECIIIRKCSVIFLMYRKYGILQDQLRYLECRREY